MGSSSSKNEIKKPQQPIFIDESSGWSVISVGGNFDSTYLWVALVIIAIVAFWILFRCRKCKRNDRAHRNRQHQDLVEELRLARLAASSERSERSERSPKMQPIPIVVSPPLSPLAAAMSTPSNLPQLAHLSADEEARIRWARIGGP